MTKLQKKNEPLIIVEEFKYQKPTRNDPEGTLEVFYTEDGEAKSHIIDSNELDALLYHLWQDGKFEPSTDNVRTLFLPRAKQPVKGFVFYATMSHGSLCNRISAYLTNKAADAARLAVPIRIRTADVYGELTYELQPEGYPFK